MAGRRFGHIENERGELIPVGTTFPDRKALVAARLHTQMQKGIVGSQVDGAESVIVSGGYPDDRDYGDEIHYTGMYGQDRVTRKQSRDQKFELENRALLVNQRKGIPVRVIRGAHAGSPHAPASGFRYDGLFLVDDAWQEPGDGGYLMCRFRLLRDASDVSEAPERPRVSLPLGNVAPPRRSYTGQRIVRDSDVALQVKELYEYACQICGIQLETATGPYAEAAHIRGLGRPHNGPDVPGNVLCLCPNHHALFDLHAFVIRDDLSLGGLHAGRIKLHRDHTLDMECVRYHRARVERLGHCAPIDREPTDE